MPPFDREAALKSAEKSLKLGKIDAAIGEYLRIVEAQPRDWNSANALGDLYVRSKQIEKGVAQYTRIADHLAEEGFYPKAAALYKKILKVNPADEHALIQFGDIASKQGLLADAKNAFKTVAELRRGKGDKKGAAEISIRIGTLDPDDLDARLGAARAALEIGDSVTALREFREVGLKLESQGKFTDALKVLQLAFDIDPADAVIRGKLLHGYLQAGDLTKARGVANGPAELKDVAGSLEAAGKVDEALEVLEDVARQDPGDLQVRASLAQAFAAKGDLVRARQYLSPETAGNSAPLWLTLAEIDLAAGRFDEGRLAVVKALDLDSSQREAAVALGCRLAESNADAGYPCLDAVADRALAEGDYAAAAAALHEFVTRVRYHVIALMRLVEICVDGGLEATMYEAQAQLADAYLEVGRGLEARIISEDLVAREPWNRANIERFRRALVMLGESDPDGIIAERLSGESPFLATDKMDLNEGIDLDADDAPFVPASNTAHEPASLDDVFTQMREEAAQMPDEEAAAEQFGLAVTYKDLGMVDEAIAALQEAARSPRQRFEAASMLGGLLLERKDAAGAIRWFERAAEVPPPSADAGNALLYDLADALEKGGEHARALALFVELEAESGGYRDVAHRIDRLSKVQAKG
jgi:tetratricopeptide (TPR) repeat protein